MSNPLQEKLAASAQNALKEKSEFEKQNEKAEKLWKVVSNLNDEDLYFLSDLIREHLKNISGYWWI